MSKIIGRSIDEIRNPLEKHLLTRRLSIEDSLKGFCEELDISYDEVIEKIGNYPSRRTYQVFDDVIPTLKMLSNYKISALSNSTPWDTIDIRKLGIEQYFDVIVNSFEIGAAKPKVEAYREIQERTNTPPEYIAMVGDSKVDIYGAKNAGWYSIYLKREGHVKSKNIEADVTIETLLDLPKVVANLPNWSK